MKFFKAILILLSIFSVVGIIFIGAYYINKNIGLFNKLFKDIKGATEDLEISDKEVTKIANDTVKIQKSVTKDVVSDVKPLVAKVQKTVKKAKKVVNSEVKTTKKVALNSRQNQVLEYIKTNSGAKMTNVSKMFNNVTPRTLRRDLEKLEQMGLLKQEGKTRDAVYKII